MAFLFVCHIGGHSIYSLFLFGVFVLFCLGFLFKIQVTYLSYGIYISTEFQISNHLDKDHDCYRETLLKYSLPLSTCVHFCPTLMTH